MAIFVTLTPHLNISVIYLRVLLIAMLIGFSQLAFSQTTAITLTGVVYNNGGSARVGDVIVIDLSTHKTSGTDGLGTFKIDCSIGDTLLFTKKNLTDQKIKVVTDVVLVVYMHSAITLNQVDIKDVTKKQELDQLMKDYNKKGVYANGKPSVLSAIFSPLNALYDLVGSGPKQARRFQRDANAEMGVIEVNKRFTVALVQQLTPLKDNSLKNFMESYRPTYADIRKMNEYDLIQYIKRSYDQFEKDGEPARQKLF